jgi:hypothetical protein
MFTSIDTYSPAVTAKRLMPAASFVRSVGQDRLHTGITLAGMSVR